MTLQFLHHVSIPFYLEQECVNMNGDENCNWYKDDGDCANGYADWMAINCKKACNLCKSK